jgi:hypothetical protein
MLFSCSYSSSVLFCFIVLLLFFVVGSAAYCALQGGFEPVSVLCGAPGRGCRFPLLPLLCCCRCCSFSIPLSFASSDLHSSSSGFFVSSFHIPLSATNCMNALNGRNIYDECCHIRINYSRHNQVIVGDRGRWVLLPLVSSVFFSPPLCILVPGCQLTFLPSFLSSFFSVHHHHHHHPLRRDYTGAMPDKQPAGMGQALISMA